MPLNEKIQLIHDPDESTRGDLKLLGKWALIIGGTVFIVAAVVVSIVFISFYVSNLVTVYNIFDYVNIGQKIPRKIEPSGITYLSDTQQLLVVSDNGGLCTLYQNGSNWSCAYPATKKYPYIDYEDVTIAENYYANVSHSVFVLIESPVPSVIEYNLDSKTIIRSFDLSQYLHFDGSKGPEGLAFVPIPDSPNFGHFYIAHSKKARIYIFEFFLGTPNSTHIALVGDVLTPLLLKSEKSGIKGFCYHPKLQILFCLNQINLDTQTDVIGWHLNDFSTIVGRWPLNMSLMTNPEGIHIKEYEGIYETEELVDTIFIADDVSRVYKAKMQRI